MLYLTRYRPWALALSALLACQLLSGCREQPGPTPGPSPTVAVTDSSPSPFETKDFDLSKEEGVELLVSAREAFEEKPPEAQNSYPDLVDLVAAWSGKRDELPEDDEERHAVIQGELVPQIQKAVAKPVSAPPGELVVGRSILDYRALRDIILMGAEPSDRLWSVGQRPEAMELLTPPLALAHAMQQHPETVSVNLFSASYAGFSLALIDRWLDDTLSQEELESLAQILARYRPSLGHLEQTISVDFAQISNSLGDDESRAQLGLGLVSDEQLKRWEEELQEVHLLGCKLYRSPNLETEPFNSAVRSVSPQIQGLIIDYPEVLTMQRRWYALYLATELAVGLELARQKEATDPSMAEVAKAVFADDPEVLNHLGNFLEVETVDGQVVVSGRPEMFHLISPEGGLLFFRR